jgi:beta-glucosidase
VQLYIRDLTSSVTVYESQLRGFERIHLKKEASNTLHGNLQPKDIAFLDSKLNPVVEAGVFEVMIGSSSEDIRLKKQFTIKTKK